MIGKEIIGKDWAVFNHSYTTVTFSNGATVVMEIDGKGGRVNISLTIHKPGPDTPAPNSAEFQKEWDNEEIEDIWVNEISEDEAIELIERAARKKARLLNKEIPYDYLPDPVTEGYNCHSFVAACASALGSDDLQEMGAEYPGTHKRDLLDESNPNLTKHETLQFDASWDSIVSKALPGKKGPRTTRRNQPGSEPVKETTGGCGGGLSE